MASCAKMTSHVVLPLLSRQHTAFTHDTNTGNVRQTADHHSLARSAVGTVGSSRRQMGGLYD
jgi:hypothetical protein